MVARIPNGLPHLARMIASTDAPLESGRIWLLSRNVGHEQLGLARASAPMIPHWVQTIRSLNAGTGTSSGHGSALSVARWWRARRGTGDVQCHGDTGLRNVAVARVTRQAPAARCR